MITCKGLKCDEIVTIGCGGLCEKCNLAEFGLGSAFEKVIDEDEKLARASKGMVDKKISIYHVEIKPDVWVDVYDVLTAFKVTNQATGHAIKKQLKSGARGYKSIEKDLNEAIQSLNRAIEIEAQSNG